MIARAVVSAAIAASVLAAAAPAAFAQDNRVDTLGTLHHKNYESPQHFAIELRLAPAFYPDVDSDPSLGGCTPFMSVFGSGKTALLSAEFDWQALRIPHIGTLGPGLGVGYATFSGNAPLASSAGGRCLTSTSTASGESTALNIYPFYGVAVFRADGPWKDLGVPFVPYVKAGLGGALWQATNTLGTSTFGGQKGQGYSLGAQLAIGVGFNLNVLDPYAAKNFDESMGVNSTYLFAEWTDASLNGLGFQSNPLRVGGTMWTFGLAWEF
jgi:opacity protein-like surface antigen